MTEKNVALTDQQAAGLALVESISSPLDKPWCTFTRLPSGAISYTLWTADPMPADPEAAAEWLEAKIESGVFGELDLGEDVNRVFNIGERTFLMALGAGRGLSEVTGPDTPMPALSGRAFPDQDSMLADLRYHARQLSILTESYTIQDMDSYHPGLDIMADMIHEQAKSLLAQLERFEEDVN